MPRAHDPRNIGTDRLPSNVIGGPIPDQGWANARDAIDDPVGFFINQLLQQIKDTTGIDLFWMLDWSWTTNTILELVRQANDLMTWLQNPIQRPPNLLARPGFSSPSAIAAAPDWFWDAVVSVGTVAGPDGRPRTDPQGSAKTTADGVRHALLSNPISGAAVAAGQILTCQMRALVESGFTASDDQAIRLELVPSRAGVLGDPVVLAHCGVPTDDPTDWIAAPVGSTAVFFDVDYRVPTEDAPDTIELRAVVSESADGDVPVRFDGARVAAAGGFLVVLADLFDAGREYLTDLWTAITDWLADMSQWSAFVSASDAAWELFVKRVKRALRHADAESYVPPSTSGIISDALKNNEWFGWLFTMVDDWLQPVLTIGKAATDFGDAVWQAVTAFSAAPGASGAWSTLTAAITTAWNTLADAVLDAWGSPKTHADFASPGTATEAALKNNPVIGWVFDLDGLLDAFVDVAKAGWDAIFGTTYYTGSFTDAWNALMDKLGWSSAPTKTIGQVGSAVGSNLLSTWVHSITDPIDDFFDSVRKYINQMIEGLHWGYFDTNWVWVPSLTTPNADKPSGDPVMTPGRNDDTTPAISSGADATIPGKPTGLVAIPWLDLTVSGFPAGKITYAIAAVKNGIEGPAAMVSAFAGTLVPPNTFGRVDLAYSAPAGGADSYRVYREVDATYEAQSWRLVATPTSDYPVLTPPLSDKTVRTSGVTAHPKTDAELAAQIVTSVKSTADGAQGSVNTIQAGLYGGTPSAPAAVGSTIDVGAVPTDIPPTKIAPVGSGANLGEDVTAAAGVASNASDAAATASVSAAIAVSKASNVPQASIVLDTSDPESEDFGVTYIGVQHIPTINLPITGWANNEPSPDPATKTTWTYTIEDGVRELYFGVTYAIKQINPPANRPGQVVLSTDKADITPVELANMGLLSNAPKVRSGIFRVAIPAAYNVGDTINFYLTTFDPYFNQPTTGDPVRTIDAWCLSVGGTTSGDFDFITLNKSPQTIDVPSDSLVVMSTFYAATGSASASITGTGIETRLTSANIPSTDPAIYMTSTVATLNVDQAGTFPYGTDQPYSARAVIVKSTIRPPANAVGSFARMVTDIATAPPSNTLVNGVCPLDGFYTALQRGSADYTVDLINSTFTVSYIGTYEVDFKFNITGSATASFQPVVLVNGAPYSYGASSMRSAVVMALTHSCLVYAKAGDVISFGVAGATAPTVSRVSGQDHATIALVNRSYL